MKHSFKIIYQHSLHKKTMNQSGVAQPYRIQYLDTDENRSILSSSAMIKAGKTSFFDHLLLFLFASFNFSIFCLLGCSLPFILEHHLGVIPYL